MRPERLGPIVASFEDGSVVHTGEDVPAAEYRDLLDAARRHARRCSPTSASASRRPASRRGIEFVLEGLHLTKRLNKDAVGARATYRARG